MLALGGVHQLAKFGGVLAGLVVLADLGLVVWGFIEIGLLRGTRGPNRYGPDPLAA